MHPGSLSTLLVQVILVLALSRVMGVLAVRVRQPRVVGEMLAGIMLGPSVFGWLMPAASARIFAPEAVQLLNVLAQVGVIFFLFLIGLELDVKLMRGRGKAALAISYTSIAAPFVLGAGLTVYLFPRVFGGTRTASLTASALFMGAAMSVTAFPVLARILTERGLHKTRVGAIAILCAAVNDVLAWCMLAFVVAVARAQGLVPGLVTAGLAVAYVLAMVVAVRPALRWLERLDRREAGPSQMILAVIVLLMLVSAAVTEWIGIHALFGAFLMGAVMPKEAKFVAFVTEKLEDFTLVFLLPLFFAYAGLHTRIGLLDSPYLWGLTGLVVLVASAGKFGGSAIAARVCGMGWREASAIGILMNTRGLMELVILTIGLQLGVINDAVFAMMVVMALVTTALTTPVLHWIFPRRMFEPAPVDEATAAAEFGVLVPVSRAESGPGLARIAATLGHAGSRCQVFGLTLLKPTVHETLGLSHFPDDPAPSAAMRALICEADRLGLPAEQMTFGSRDIPADIARVARAKRADLVLIGAHNPVFGHALLGGTVPRVLTGADVDVAVLVDRGVSRTPSILVPYQGSPHDRLALDLARRMAACPGVTVTILHVVPPGQGKTNSMHAGDAGEAGGIRKQTFPDSVDVWVIEDASPVDAVLRQSGDFDLVLVGLSEEWGLESHLFGVRAERIARDWPGSLLLVRRHTPLPVMSSKDRDGRAAGIRPTPPHVEPLSRP